MTVAELRELLKEIDPDRLVVISRDAEGNGYSPLSGFWTGSYRAESRWSGEAGLESLTPEDRKAGFSEEDVIEDGVPAVFLGPVG